MKNKSTITGVWDEEKGEIIALAGTVQDFRNEGILKSCSCDPKMWAIIDRKGHVRFGKMKPTKQRK